MEEGFFKASELRREQRRVSDTERSELAARREVLRHMEWCKAERCDTCLMLSRRWGRAMLLVKQEQKHLAGCA